MTNPVMPPADLLPRCLSWVESHLDWFTPEVWNAHYPPQQVPTQTVLELLLLCRVLERGPQAAETRPLVESARTLAHDQVVQPWFAAGLEQPDPNLPYTIWLLGLLPPDGDGVPVLRERVQQLLNRHGRGLLAFDWPVTSQIELGYACWSGGFAADLPDFAELRGESAYLGRDPALVSEPEAYAVTHELLYAGDLGGRPLPVGSAARLRITGLVDSLLAGAVADAQLDLTAELLHCRLLTGAPGDDQLWERGWQAVAAAQLGLGAIPGPPYRAEIAAEQPPDKTESYEFRTCYHTTLVAAMAAAAAEVAA